MSDVRLVLMTAPSAEVAETIVTELVREQMIACGNITLDVASIYRWQGKVERAGEVLIIMKTTADAYDAVQRRILQMHPYEVPEILSLPIENGYDAYLEWVRASVATSSDREV